MRRGDPTLPEVFDRADAEKAGMTSGQVQRRLGSGAWRPLRRGAFCTAATWDDADLHGRHRLAVLAALKVSDGPLVASHASAAVLHGWPMPRRPGPVWLTTTPRRPCRYLRDLVVEAATIRPADRWELDGVPVTSPSRTVVDCLRHLDAEDAVAVADAALHEEPDLARHLQRVLDECSNWPYAARAALRLPLVDGRRESPLESRSFVLMHRMGLPLPEPQVLVSDEQGVVVARVDALWDERVVGEVDGLVKYGIGAEMDPKSAREALVAEKLREDALRELGLEVVRWGSKDLDRPASWAARIRSKLAQPSRRPVTARFTYSPDDRSARGKPITR